MKTIAISEFKAKCLAILEEISRTGERVLIVKRGKPIAQVSPPTSSKARYPQDDLRGKGEIVGDLISPVLPAADWNVLHDESAV